MRGPYASGNPAKYAYQYPRPWPMNEDGEVADTGRTDAFGHPVYESDVVVDRQPLRRRGRPGRRGAEGGGPRTGTRPPHRANGQGRGAPLTVPKGTEVPLETRLPYLDAAQRREVLRSTGLPVGHVLLDGFEQWGRLDLLSLRLDTAPPPAAGSTLAVLDVPRLCGQFARVEVNSDALRAVPVYTAEGLSVRLVKR